MISFTISDASQPLLGKLIYSLNDCSFRFENEVADTYEYLKRAGVGTAPFVIDHYLQLETGVETGCILYIHGVSVHGQWKREPLPQIDPAAGIVRAQFDREMKAAVGVRLVPPGVWVTVHDQVSGWIYMGPQAIPQTNHFIEFAENTVAALAHESLVALWLKPMIV
jgi:hypothetical protein